MRQTFSSIRIKNSSSQFANILRVFKFNLNLIHGLFTGFRPFLHSFLSTILLFILLFSLFLFSFFGWCVSCVYIVSVFSVNRCVLDIFSYLPYIISFNSNGRIKGNQIYIVTSKIFDNEVYKIVSFNCCLQIHNILLNDWSIMITWVEMC